jgi:hypothetical protein
MVSAAAVRQLKLKSMDWSADSAQSRSNRDTSAHQLASSNNFS